MAKAGRIPDRAGLQREIDASAKFVEEPSTPASISM
jgi:hypothetical protein